MKEIEELARLCKAGVHISINGHKDVYETIEGFLSFNEEKVDPDILQEMVDRDRMVCVQVYPHTPVGFYVIYHYDLETAVTEMLELIRRVVNE